MPLLAQVGRDDDEHLRRLSAQRCEITSLPRWFCQTHFVGQYDATRKRVAAGKKGGVNLMRVEIDLQIDQCQASDCWCRPPRDVLSSHATYWL